MPKNFAEFLHMMDERLWFRMIVCMLPGLVAAKLVGFSDSGSFLSNIGTAVLIIGIALYAFWARIRGFSNVADAEVEHEDDTQTNEVFPNGRADVSGQEQFDMLAEMRALCQEADRESDRLIALELAVNPNLSFAEATRSALERRRILGK